MSDNVIEQDLLQLVPPYGTRIVQHLHHVELMYAKKEVKTVLNWILDLHTELVARYIQSSPKNHKQCTCNNGYTLDASRTNEVFPDGVPVKCSICCGVGYIDSNDIIPPTTERTIEIPNLEPETSEPTKYEI